MIFTLIVWGFLAGCGSETDTGMKNALDRGHITSDINVALAAPFIPYLGIIRRFNVMLSTADKPIIQKKDRCFGENAIM